jgi:Glutathione S-transferase, C-terminal domain
LRACRATGTSSAQQQLAAEREYEGVLGAITEQLGQTRFLLGDRPCAADEIVLGGLLAHTCMDPDPKAVVARFPRVVEWCKRDALDWDGGGELVPFPDSTPFAQKMLAAMRTTYVPFILANAKALRDGEKAFIVSTYGEEVSYMTRPYPERSRQMIIDRLHNLLDDGQRSVVYDWLAENGLYECFVAADHSPT